MPIIEQVQKQIRQLDNYSKVISFREIRELPNILWEDEVVEKLI